MNIKESFANLLIYLGLIILTAVTAYAIIKILGWILLGCTIIGILLILLGVSMYDNYEE